MAIDYGQTLDIASNPQWKETNPILGEHPTRSEVTRYFAVAAVLHPTISALLPTDKCLGPVCDWRKAWQWVTIGVEAGYVAHNYSLGIRTDF